MNRFDGTRAKLLRANEQVQSLRAKLRAAFDLDRDMIECEIKAEPEHKPPNTSDPRPWIAFTIEVSKVPSYGQEIGIALGEILHNYRSTLDHFAWILVPRKSRLSAAKRQRIAFPMTKSSGSYWKRAPSIYLPGVPRDKLALIERYQPYRRSTTGRIMRCLRTLSDIDKHRIVVPVRHMPKQVTMKIEYEGGREVDTKYLIATGDQLKKGTKLMRVVLAETHPGQAKVRVKDGTVPWEAVFPTSVIRPPAHSHAVSVEVVLRSMGLVCQEILDQFSVCH